MSRGVVDALTRGADPAAALSPDVVVRARSRIAAARRRRASWWAGGSVTLLAAAALAVGTWAQPAQIPAAAASPTPSETPAARPSILRAEDLAAAMEPRARAVEPDSVRQAGLLCPLDGLPPGSLDSAVGTSCGSVWMGEGRLLRLDESFTRATAYSFGDSSVVMVTWMAVNSGPVPIALDPAGAVVSLVTDPGAVTDTAYQSGFTQVASSLWLGDQQRMTVLTAGAAVAGSSLSDVWVLAPGESASGEATFVSHSDTPLTQVADIAAGRAEATVVVQIPVVPAASPAANVLLVEAEHELADVPAGLSGDVLAADGVPRAMGEPVPDGAQAAMLCEIPEALREDRELAQDGQLTSSGDSAESVCAPLWVPGPVFADHEGTTIVTDEGAPEDTTRTRVLWSVDHKAHATVLTDNWSLLIEGVASEVRTEGSALTRLGDTIVTQTSAWLPDGRRVALLSTQAYRFEMEPGSSLGMESTLFPGMLTSDQPVDAGFLVRSLGDAGVATVLTELPLFADPSRVLILETPLGAPADG